MIFIVKEICSRIIHKLGIEKSNIVQIPKQGPQALRCLLKVLSALFHVYPIARFFLNSGLFLKILYFKIVVYALFFITGSTFWFILSLQNFEIRVSQKHVMLNYDLLFFVIYFYIRFPTL